MTLKSLFTLFAIVLIFRINGFSGEGMWIPMLLEQLNEKEMVDMGMRITAEDIYSINRSSMKDAIVLFGRGCTAEIISGEGLLLTNHHCGYSRIQQHSSVENDYLTDGFWAMSRDEELPNPGLTVTMMTGMEEVTDQVLEGVTDDMSIAARRSRIAENAARLIREFEEGSDYMAAIRSFFTGNAYYMITTQTFYDVRLVGAPPSNIGKFGGDTDNWMWPRHTGDFSLFRIYVGPDGKPATYAEENIPYQPEYFFPLSLKGVEEGDFTFVFGYPARTDEYLPSDAIVMNTQIRNPGKIMLRETRMEIFSKYSDTDPKIRIQYATKHFRISNYWKKMIGEIKGISRMNGIAVKEAYEESFNKWALNTAVRKEKYGGLLNALEKTYLQMTPYYQAYDYYREAGLAVELVSFAGKFKKLTELSQHKESDPGMLDLEIQKLKSSSDVFFKDYYRPIDEEVMTALYELYDQSLGDAFKPDFFAEIKSGYEWDYGSFSKHVFGKSIFTDREKVAALLDGYKPRDHRRIIKDPAFEIYAGLASFYEQQVKPALTPLLGLADSLQRIYMKAQMEMQPDHRFYPDANSTLRVTYGEVKGYDPADAVSYRYYTTLEGIMEKEDPDIYDYVVEERLKALYLARDYGDYAANDGTMRVAFIATNHTTGGNSGSPVLNADGHLVGVNFDRCWEGTSSDFMYNPEVCRNISLDIRYFLFIVDKYAGAGYLLDEMKIIHQ